MDTYLCCVSVFSDLGIKARYLACGFPKLLSSKQHTHNTATHGQMRTQESDLPAAKGQSKKKGKKEKVDGRKRQKKLKITTHEQQKQFMKEVVARLTKSQDDDGWELGADGELGYFAHYSRHIRVIAHVYYRTAYAGNRPVPKPSTLHKAMSLSPPAPSILPLRSGSGAPDHAAPVPW